MSRPSIKMSFTERNNRDNRYSVGAAWQATNRNTGEDFPGKLNFKWSTYQAPSEIEKLVREFERLSEKYYIDLSVFEPVSTINGNASTASDNDDF